MGETRMPEFNDLLGRWKKVEDGVTVTSFAVASPKRHQSKAAKENEEAIRAYKSSFEEKKFKTRAPTRGMSAYQKPAQLKNVFGHRVGNILDYESPRYEKSEDSVDLIHKSLGSSLFFDDLLPKDLDAFIDAFEPIEVKAGTVLMKQGDKADFFYIIGEGTIAFTVDGEKRDIRGVGESFGEISLLYSCLLAATAMVETERASLFRVNQRTFVSLLQKQSRSLQSEKKTLLKSVDFLKEMDRIDLRRLGMAMIPKQFQAGEYLVKKGDVGDAFYILKEGEVKVHDISVGAKTFDDVRLKAGDYFGERALVTNEPRAANVVAATDGIVFSIDRETFEKIMGKFSRIIMKAQDRRILDGIEVLTLANISADQLQELSHLVEDKAFEDGEIIFDPSRKHDAAVYILREGTVELSGKRVEEIKPGGYFGEEMLLLDVRQEGTAYKQAQTKCHPLHKAKSVGHCICGVLSLSECRRIFDTTKMIDILDRTESSVNEDNEEVSEDDMAVATAPVSSLKRETTKQWLAESSKEKLRKAVRSSLDLDDFDKMLVLGEGQFGEVWLVSAKLPGELGHQVFALKEQKKDDPTRGDSIKAVRREIDVLGAMDHPFIVHLVHHYESSDHLYILMGLVQGGELFDVIHTEQEDGTWASGLPESDAKFYAMVIADTLDYIHRKQYVFRDLKPENVLIDSDGYPTICDFGFAKQVVDKTYTLCGTPNYLAPEVIMNRGHNASVDHWALGVLIYEMVAGENPFFYDGMPQMELFQSIVREKFYPLPDEVSDDAFYVVDELLEKDPNLRLGSLAGRGKDIIAKDWFRELDLGELRQKRHPAPFVPKKEALSETLQKSFDEPSDIERMQSAASIALLDSSPRLGSMALMGTSNTSSLLDDSDEDD